MNHKRNERRLCGATLKTAEVVRIYHFPLFLQRETALRQRKGEAKRCRFFHQRKRSCVCCGRRIRNRSLGGYSGRSALSGFLFCLRCADCPPQLLLPVGDL